MQSNALNISINSITKTYGDFHALNDVNLEVNSGEFLTLLGPSGSGKTTLLMVLAGFTRPDYGSVKFGEEEVILKPPHLREIGMVFQNYALFPHMKRNLVWTKLLASLSWMVWAKDASANCQVGKSKGSLWPAQSFLNQKFYSWMSRSRRWIKSCAKKCR